MGQSLGELEETVLEEVDERGKARVAEIDQEVNGQLETGQKVADVLDSLDDKGYVTTTPDGLETLTSQGEAYVEEHVY